MIRAEAATTPTCQSANSAVVSWQSTNVICFAIYILFSNQGLVQVGAMEEWRCGVGGEGVRGMEADWISQHQSHRHWFQTQGLWQRRWSPTTEREDH